MIFFDAGHAGGKRETMNLIEVALKTPGLLETFKKLNGMCTTQMGHAPTIIWKDSTTG